MDELGIWLESHPRRPGAPIHHDYSADELPSAVSALVGERISAVYYYDSTVSIGAHTKYWNQLGDLADYIFCVELTLESGQVLALRSQLNHFHRVGDRWVPLEQPICKGLGAGNYLILETSDARSDEICVGTVWNVSQQSRWHPVIGTRVSDVQFYCGTLAVEGGKPQWCILDVVLCFETGHRIWLSTNRMKAFGGALTRDGHYLLVVFDEEHARELQVGNYSGYSLERYSGLAPAIACQEQVPDLAPALSWDELGQGL